jgi:hypothetical protein
MFRLLHATSTGIHAALIDAVDRRFTAAGQPDRMIGFCKPGVSHPVSPATIGALRAPCLLPPLAEKSTPPIRGWPMARCRSISPGFEIGAIYARVLQEFGE